MSLGVNLGIGLTNQLAFGRGLPYTIKNKLLFLGNYSSIVDGKMPNALGSDWLTVNGVAGSETYQCPNTPEYKSADKDLYWFDFSGARAVTSSDMVSYDLNRTFIYYNGSSPFNIISIAIAKQDAIFTQEELDTITKYFHLSIFWSGGIEIYGEIKNNAILGKREYVSLYSILSDGNSKFYDFTDISRITKDGSNRVSSVEEMLGSGANLIQATQLNQPIYSSDGITFDGVNDSLQALFSLSQPISIYYAFKQITWVLSAQLLDGNGNRNLAITQNPSSPSLSFWSLGSVADSSSAIGQKSIIRIVANGASSSYIVNDHGNGILNAGTVAMNGITLGRRGNLESSYGNFIAYGLVVRTVADSIDVSNKINSFLKSKYNI